MRPRLPFSLLSLPALALYALTLAAEVPVLFVRMIIALAVVMLALLITGHPVAHSEHFLELGMLPTLWAILALVTPIGGGWWWRQNSPPRSTGGHGGALRGDRSDVREGSQTAGESGLLSDEFGFAPRFGPVGSPTMSQIELRERFFGSGYTGTVDISPALSWADRDALRRVADGSMATALGLQDMTDGLDELGGSLIQAVASLERRLGLELYAQTQLLEEQLGALERIEQALRRPGQTRAAERIASAGELLRRGRYERALAESRIAIEEDPNSPGGFVGSAWALFGLRRTDEAKSCFVEAAEAADDDERAGYFWCAGRLAFVDGDPDGAMGLLSRADGCLSDFTKCTLSYESAVYLAAKGAIRESQGALRLAVEHHEAFAYMAIADPSLVRSRELQQIAEGALDRRRATLEAHRKTAEEHIQAVRDAMSEAGQPLPVESQDAGNQLSVALSELEAALREIPIDPERPLTVAGSHVEAIEAKARALSESAKDWCAATAQRRTDERNAKDAVVLENEARKLAAQHTAMPIQKPDGSWVIVRKRTLGQGLAWRVSLTDRGITAEEISWRDRYHWD